MNAAPSIPGASPSTNPARGSVLFVDDDPVFLAQIAQVMRVHSGDRWDILTAPSARRAMEGLRQNHVALAVIDLQMPVTDGLQLLMRLHEQYPALAKLVLTGQAIEPVRDACQAAGAHLVLPKPRTRAELNALYAALDDLLARARPATEDQAAVSGVAANATPSLVAQTETVLICTPEGEVLHMWGCPDLDLWVKFLDFVALKARCLTEGLALGEFDRLELEAPDTHAVVLQAADRRVLVRTRMAAGDPA